MMIKLFKSISEGILFRAKHIGKLPICNCRKDRSPHIGNFSFILCWRCTSILTSFFIFKLLVESGLINIEIIQSHNIWLIIILSIFLMLPTAINGIKQYYLGIESTNGKRIFTGFLCGIGLFLLIYTLKYIVLLT